MRSQMLILLSAASLASVLAAEEASRAKRSYGYGYDYGYGVDGDFWYAGRILGIIVGISMLLLCCCIPCVCIAGVWFLGWFGLRQRGQRSKAAAASRNQASSSSPQRAPESVVVSHPIRVDASPSPPPPRRYSDVNNVIYAAEDRFYTSSAPSGDRRPEPYRASKF